MKISYPIVEKCFGDDFIDRIITGTVRERTELDDQQHHQNMLEMDFMNAYTALSQSEIAELIVEEYGKEEAKSLLVNLTRAIYENSKSKR